jgi:hypothetical protein
MMNYKKGGKPCKVEDSKVVVDPRSETSFRGKSYLAVGNKQAVKGSRAARKQKDVTWV